MVPILPATRVRATPGRVPAGHRVWIMSSPEVIVLPGGQYGPHSPLLMYAADAAEQRGATIRPIWWDEYDRPLTLTPDERGPWVLDQFARAVPDVPADTLLIAKSLGTYAAVVAADRKLPAVWLTPVLTSPFVVDALRRSTAPFLLVGGTADELWDSKLARELTPYCWRSKEPTTACSSPAGSPRLPQYWDRQRRPSRTSWIRWFGLKRWPDCRRRRRPAWGPAGRGRSGG